MQNICSSTLHHHLNKAHQTNQSPRVIQFVATFDKLGLSMAEKMTEDYNVPELIDRRMYWSNFDSQ